MAMMDISSGSVMGSSRGGRIGGGRFSVGDEGGDGEDGVIYPWSATRDHTPEGQ